MKDHLQGGLAIGKGDPFTGKIYYFDTFVSKHSLFQGYVIHVLELILDAIILWHDDVKCSQKSDHGGAYQLWCDQITIHQSVCIIRQQLVL